MNTCIIIIDCIHSPFKSEALLLEWYYNHFYQGVLGLWNDCGDGVILTMDMVKDHCCNSTANIIVTSITYCSQINTPL